MTANLPSLGAFVRFFIDLRGDLSIAHQIPGRVRFQLALSGLGKVATHDLSLSFCDLKRVNGVEDVRFNAMARSLVVSYNPDKIPDSFWTDCLAVHDDQFEDLIAQTLRLRAEA